MIKFELFKNQDNYNNESKDLTKTNKCLKDEMNRIVNYYKTYPENLLLIFLIMSTIYYILKIPLKTHLIQKGGGEGDREKFVESIFDIVLNRSLLAKLKTQYPLNSSFNYLIIIPTYIFLAFIVRPFKYISYFIIMLFAISGSFLFPFLIIGMGLYYVLKKIVLNKKPNF
jgi:hypothetical protein